MSGAHNESERGKKAGAGTPTHLFKNCDSTHDGLVSKDRLVMADGTRTYGFLKSIAMFCLSYREYVLLLLLNAFHMNRYISILTGSRLGFLKSTDMGLCLL